MDFFLGNIFVWNLSEMQAETHSSRPRNSGSNKNNYFLKIFLVVWSEFYNFYVGPRKIHLTFLTEHPTYNFVKQICIFAAWSGLESARGKTGIDLATDLPCRKKPPRSQPRREIKRDLLTFPQNFPFETGERDCHSDAVFLKMTLNFLTAWPFFKNFLL